MIRPVLTIACFLMAWPAARAADPLVVLPSEFSLGTPESRQRLILQEVERGEVGRQVSEAIEWSSSDPGVATVADGIVSPVRDGEATITASAGGRSATAKVKVSGLARPFGWSFRGHVEP